MRRSFNISLTVAVLLILSLSLTQCIEEPTAPVLTAVGGVVKDGNGALVEGANVTLSDKNVVTNSKGAYYIDDISSGSYTIKISKNNYAEAEKNIVITTGMVISEELTIIRLGGIAGEVTNANGNGEEGVKITTTPQSKEALTDAEGKYSLLDLESNSYIVKAVKPGFASQTIQTTVLNGEINSVNFGFLTLGGIVGKVTNDEGTGEEGVKITTTPATIEILTDANGNYSLLDLASGSYVVKGEKEKFATITKSVTVIDGQISNGNLSVLTLGGISGKVTDANSNPLEGVKITTTPTTEEVLTDANGSYSLLDLSAGDYTIEVEKAGYKSKTKSVTVINGQLSNGDISILRLGGISGKVTDADSNPVEGVKIITTPTTVEVLTDASGNYSLLDLTAGEYIIQTAKISFTSKTKSIIIVDGQISNGDISISTLGGISGRVTDVHGNPVSEVKITSIPSTTEVFTDAEGNYYLMDLIAGSYDIKTEKEKFAITTKTVLITDGQMINGDITILSLGSITGKVVDVNSNPLEGVKITTTPVTTEVVTAADGNYNLIDLNAGSYTIQAEIVGFIKKSNEVAVADGEISRGDITLIKDLCVTPTIIYLGKTYNTIQIGDQCWLKENLDVGTIIQSTEGIYQQTDNGIIEKYCYNNDSANCDLYGGLYEWPEAMQYATTEGAQGICPDGWHIPKIQEFSSLLSYVDNLAKTLMDENAKWGYGFKNETGFSALLPGHRFYWDGDFYYLGWRAYFWSSYSTEFQAQNLIIDYDISAPYLHLIATESNYKEYGFNVRCIKD